MACASDDVGIFIGSTDGNEWSGQLAADGEYTIRVYLMRSAARRNDTANYTLTVGITGSAAPVPSLGAAPAGDAKVKGTPYHAAGQVPCSMGSAPQVSAPCDHGVIRSKPGKVFDRRSGAVRGTAASRSYRSAPRVDSATPASPP